MNLKDIFKDGSLTFEQFDEACKKANVKFEDVSSGAYVSKNKYDDDIKQRDTRIQTLTDTVTARENDINGLNDKITQSEGTYKTTLEDVKTQLSTLQGQYDTEKQNYQKQLAEQKYEYAVRDYANNKKFTSNAAKRDFISSMIAKKLSMEEDKILGADDFTTSYSAENADAFVVEKQEPDKPLPQFGSEPDSTGGDSGDSDLFHFNFTGVR